MNDQDQQFSRHNIFCASLQLQLYCQPELFTWHQVTKDGCRSAQACGVRALLVKRRSPAAWAARGTPARDGSASRSSNALSQGGLKPHIVDYSTGQNRLMIFKEQLCDILHHRPTKAQVLGGQKTKGTNLYGTLCL